MREYFLGIDASKGYADFVLVDSRKRIVEENFQLDDTFEGHGILFRFLSDFLGDSPTTLVYAGIESTGGYENNWYHSLKTFQHVLPVQVARLNPVGVRHSGKAEMHRNVTDKMSAKNVALYLINHRQKVDFETEEFFGGLKRLWTYVRMLKKQRTQLLNQLDPLLYSAHPQLQPYCREGIRQWILQLLLRYPTALHLSRARVSGVSNIPYISKERAQELIRGAQSTVASATDEVTAGLIQSVAKKIGDLEQEIAQQKQVLERHCALPEVQLLKTFKGIGTYSAVGLVMEIGAIERFPSAKHLASFFGLHPEVKISGDGIQYIGMSKKGRRVPREILFNVAMSAVTTNPHMQQLYTEYVDKGKHPMAALGIIMHKILRIVYGMLKNNTAYNGEIDRLNRTKHNEKNKEKPCRDHDRRYQRYDANAPISRRQHKRRKERVEVQNVLTFCSDSSSPLFEKKVKKDGG